MTKIPSELVLTYKKTDFRVLEPQAFTLRVRQHFAELQSLLVELGVKCAGYLTVWNPYIAETSTVDSIKAQLSLIRSLSPEGYSTLKALRVDPASEWPGKESVFVSGLNLELTKSFGVEFGRNATVWAGSDAVPQLVLLR